MSASRPSGPLVLFGLRPFLKALWKVSYLNFQYAKFQKVKVTDFEIKCFRFKLLLIFIF